MLGVSRTQSLPMPVGGITPVAMPPSQAFDLSDLQRAVTIARMEMEQADASTFQWRLAALVLATAWRICNLSSFARQNGSRHHFGFGRDPDRRDVTLWELLRWGASLWVSHLARNFCAVVRR
jgi:hypothetical protein